MDLLVNSVDEKVMTAKEIELKIQNQVSSSLHKMSFLQQTIYSYEFLYNR